MSNRIQFADQTIRDAQQSLWGLMMRTDMISPVAVEQVVSAPIVAWPLGLYDCCGVRDGAAAAVVVRAHMAKSFRPDPIYAKALAISVGAGQAVMRQDYDYVHIEENERASRMAYQQAGIKDPRREISLAEVHDCFTTHELILYEDLGFSTRGRAAEAIEFGTLSLTGGLPVNTDGGPKCFGHPLGASGLRMMYEIYKQVQAKAGARQMADPRFGLAHNLGGNAGMSTASCVVLGNEK